MLWGAWAAPAKADCVSAQHLDGGLTAASADGAAAPVFRRNLRGRMVTSVLVDGRGPFRFIVDTGANRSAVSPRVAAQLGLTVAGSALVHSIHEVIAAPIVDVQSISYGGIRLASSSLPVLDGEFLAGEDGLMGIDGMQGQRMRMDFERRCIEILPSRAAPPLRGWTTVRGRLQFGGLVVVEGRIRRLRINVLIDTGSDSTLANTALRDRLRTAARVDLGRTDYARAFSAGVPVALEDAILIPKVSIGSVEARSIVAYVGDFHVFDVWGLSEEPTLLIGMDVLTQTRAIAIDYERGTVSFRTRVPVRTGSRLPGTANGPLMSIVR